jgi:hypothetical protein
MTTRTHFTFRMPNEPIMLRQGARVVKDSRRRGLHEAGAGASGSEWAKLSEPT